MLASHAPTLHAFWLALTALRAGIAGLRNDLPGLAYPMNKTQLDGAIADALAAEGAEAQAAAWEGILTAIHEQAIYLPLSFMTNPAVYGSRLAGFEFGSQQFDIPVQQLRVAGGLREAEAAAAGGDSQGGTLSAGAIAGIAVASVVALAAAAFGAFLVVHERRGQPVFAPLLPPESERSVPGPALRASNNAGAGAV